MSNSVTPWTSARQASLYITNSRSLLRLMSIESVMSSSHLILCHPLFLPPSVFPSMGVFPNESVLHIRWPKYWSFSFSISPSDEYSGLISFRIDCLDLLQSKELSRILSNTSVQKLQFFSTQLSLHSNSKELLKVTVSVCAQECLTLCDPMDCSPPGSSVHEIIQARILEWVAIPFTRGSS